MDTIHTDIIIIGAGPAGMTAAIYTARAGLDTLIFENKYPGGQIVITESVENYPGFTNVPTGYELAMKFQEHINCFDNVKLLMENITEIDLSENKKFKIITDNKQYICKSVILCTGASPRTLDIPGEKKFTGRGVSYCGTCDAAFFKNKIVAVIGGGDTALEEADYLTKFADKVYLIHRRDKFRAVKTSVDRVIKNSKIEIIYDSIPMSINGDKKVENLQIKNIKTEQEHNIKLDGIFVFVGYIPSNSIIPDSIKKNSNGYVTVNSKQETSVAGVFAAGDICDKYLRQIITACGDGAVAGYAAMRYIDEY